MRLLRHCNSFSTEAGLLAPVLACIAGCISQAFCYCDKIHDKNNLIGRRSYLSSLFRGVSSLKQNIIVTRSGGRAGTFWTEGRQEANSNRDRPRQDMLPVMTFFHQNPVSLKFHLPPQKHHQVETKHLTLRVFYIQTTTALNLPMALWQWSEALCLPASALISPYYQDWWQRQHSVSEPNHSRKEVRTQLLVIINQGTLTVLQQNLCLMATCRAESRNQSG